MKLCKVCNKKDDKLYHGKCSACYRVYKYNLGKKPQSRYKKYKNSAKHRGIKFSISYEYFLKFQNQPCKYCGDIPDKISLDRIDNDLGYIEDNLASCCSLCNSFKHIYEEDLFIKHITKIYKHQNENL